MFVNEAMHANVASCQPGDNLEQVSKLMWDNDCGSIPVIDDDGKPAGIITDRDIAMAAMLNHKPLWELPAEQVITNQNLITCTRNDTVEKVLDLMAEHCVRRIPVIGEDGRLCGIVSLGDAVAFTADGPLHGEQPGVEVHETLTMLKHVSGHHQDASRPMYVE